MSIAFPGTKESDKKSPNLSSRMKSSRFKDSGAVIQNGSLRSPNTDGLLFVPHANPNLSQFLDLALQLHSQADGVF
jgi:hypothetical protein